MTEFYNVGSDAWTLALFSEGGRLIPLLSGSSAYADANKGRAAQAREETTFGCV